MNKEQKTENLIPRPPVVVVMGHIDHGKTKLLDYIRKTNTVGQEAGGITQHIGAYEAVIGHPPSPKATGGQSKITFIDTPGHEAFSKMRSRGAKIADIAILVIAADEGIKPQTIEAIKTIEQAKIPFLAAINKIDKPAADPEKIKKQLSENNVLIEDWGGKVPALEISAKTGKGVNELLETILLLAELEELKADPNQPGSGIVIESHLEPKRGVVATLLIQNGTLEQGIFVASGRAIAKIKIFEDFLGNQLKTARFSSPVRIIGFNQPPEVGSIFQSFDSKEQAVEFIKQLPEQGPPTSRGTSEVQKEVQEPAEKAILLIIVKADTAGSLEAIKQQIEKTGKEKDNLEINILRTGIGNISEDDIKFASSSQEKPVVIGFNISYDSRVAELAEKAGVLIKTFEVIYEIADWLEQQIEQRTAAIVQETIIGKVKILKIFRTEKNKQIVGGKVVSGKIAKGKKVKILRRGAVLTQGKILNLEQTKTKVEEVEETKEFGALIETPINISPNDELEVLSN